MSHPQNHPSAERTLVVIKPDGVQRNLIGEIIKRFEQTGLKLVAIKMLVASAEHVEAHYTLDPEWRRVTGEKRIAAAKEKGEILDTNDPFEITKKVLEVLQGYMSAGPVVAMVWEGAGAVKIVRKLVGSTEPLSSAPGTIRGDYVIDSYSMADTDNRAVRNLIHASGSPAEAEMEIKHWFKPHEIIDYTLLNEAILYNKDLDGIL